jgi:hypothetical protein
LSLLLAVSGVQEQTICSINLKLGTLSNEEDIALSHVVRLALGGELALALGDEQNAGSVDGTKSLLLTLAESRHEHVKLAHRRSVNLSLAVLATVVRFAAQHAIFGIVRLEGQSGSEEIGRVTLSSRAKSSVEDVIAAGHALNDITSEVGVDTIGGDVDTLACFENEIVHGDEGNQDTVVGLIVLLSQTGDKFRNVSVLAEFRLVKLGQSINDRSDSLLIGLQQGVDGLLEDLIVKLAVFRDELLQRIDLEEGLDAIKRLETTECLELGQSEGDLRLVVGIGKVLRILLVQFGSKLLVGVQLERKGLCDGQDLGQKRKVGVTVLVNNVLADKLFRVLVDDIL